MRSICLFAIALTLGATACKKATPAPTETAAPVAVPPATPPPAAPPTPSAAALAANAALPCLECEMKSSLTHPDCANVSRTPNLRTTDPAKFGCDGFPAADRDKCKALLACLRTKKCASGSTPTPCLCGPMDPQACSDKPVKTLPGACRDEYIAAAKGGDLYTLFFSSDSMVGVANNLYACDVEAHCTCP
ncbi:MAG TPA: hypothetical protein VHJ20_00455 [Polyangia bacterium]|nr:hypothetical protein [Polyangia bacterium]